MRMISLFICSTIVGAFFGDFKQTKAFFKFVHCCHNVIPFIFRVHERQTSDVKQSLQFYKEENHP